MKTRRNVLTTLGAIAIPAPVLAETKPSYEVACTAVSIWRKHENRYKLLGITTCHTEAEALEFVNQHYAEWAAGEMANYKEKYREEFPWPKRFKPFESLTDDSLHDHWGFQGFVNKTTPV